MRIAVVTDDGARLSRHFGRALYFAVFSLEGGAVVGREVRSKAHHGSLAAHGLSDGRDAGSQAARHGSMIDAIRDCEVVVSGGMGEGAYNGLRASGLEVAFVQSDTVEDAVRDYLAGRTVDRDLCRH